MMATGTQADDEDAAKIREPRGDSSYRLIQVMTTYGREFCFLLAVIFTAFAAFQNGPLKTRKANPPQRFFPLSSLVTDFYVGNMQALSSLLLENDVSIVMYYAPWDANCIQARSEFETAARFYHAQVFFAAVNCWWPEGECRRSLKLQSYPLFLAHVRRVGSVTYNGPLLATYLIPFLDNVLSPVSPIHQQGELLDLQAQHEAVMVGYFEFHTSPQPPGYRQYYIAALKTLTRDPSRRLGFAVVTSRAAAVRLRVTVESVVLHSWNRTEVYPEQLIKYDNLVTWAYNKMSQVCTWLTPSGTKSRLMAQVMEKSPTLLLFTPRNLMLGPPPYYDLLRETAMTYYNCESTASVTSIIHRIILKRHIKQRDFEKLREMCSPRNIDMTLGSDLPYASTCCQSRVIRTLLKPPRDRCFCSACLHATCASITSSRDATCYPNLKKVLKAKHLYRAPCNSRRFSYPLHNNPFYYLSVKCLSRQSEFAKSSLSEAVGSTTQVTGVEDDRILKMAVVRKKQQCRHLNLALKYSTFDFPTTPMTPGLAYWQSNFTGLGCRTNRSLNFMAMDTVLHSSFAEHLGLDIFTMPHQTAAVIIEAAQESQYLLADVNKLTLVDFIKNFTLGSLDRYLRSFSDKFPRPSTSEEEMKGALCVMEVTTDTFNQIVLNPRQDVILMYYAPWCVFCNGISHIYLTVAKFFMEVEGLTFARINGDLNDLPWEYTVEKYPSLIFFPAYRKAESVEYPTSLPMTPVNLVQFVLANAHPNVRWKTAMQLCDGKCQTQNALQSNMQVQDLFLELRTLRNQLQLLEDYLFNMARDDLSKKFPSSLFKEDVGMQWQGLREYRNHLIDVLRDKKKKIRQARELQHFLRRKQRHDSADVKKLIKDLARPSDTTPRYRSKYKTSPDSTKDKVVPSDDVMLSEQTSIVSGKGKSDRVAKSDVKPPTKSKVKPSSSKLDVKSDNIKKDLLETVSKKTVLSAADVSGSSIKKPKSTVSSQSETPKGDVIIESLQSVPKNTKITDKSEKIGLVKTKKDKPSKLLANLDFLKPKVGFKTSKTKETGRPNILMKDSSQSKKQSEKLLKKGRRMLDEL